MNSDNKKNRVHAFERGAVSMEMIIICVLIAAVCLVGVIALGRAMFRDTDVINKAVRGDDPAKAISCPDEGYRKQAEDDIGEADKFSKQMSGQKK